MASTDLCRAHNLDFPRSFPLGLHACLAQAMSASALISGVSCLPPTYSKENGRPPVLALPLAAQV